MLGLRAKDKITGFTGTITAVCKYIDGCIQYGLTPVAKDNSYPDTKYIDYQRIDILNPDDTPIVEPSDTGGERRNKSEIPKSI